MMRIIINIFLVLIPLLSFSNIVVSNGLTHHHVSKEGDIVTGEIIVINNGEETENITIYTEDLPNACLEDDKLKTRSLLDWLEVDVSQKSLLPKEEYTIKYTLKIPEGGINSGSYWGLILVEVAKPIKEEVIQGGVRISSKVRYGIQIINDIGNEDDVKMDFQEVQIEKINGEHHVEAIVKNNGNFVVKPAVILELFKDGEKIKNVELPFKKVYPNSCKDFTFVIDDLAAGNYDGVIVADDGENLIGINITIEVDN
ncbi:hypothetical protein UJ101_00280 [Flavobacteriaceae bacterium UJ101]|nr:hypothetical protein UJ101_00280 [Flavobacteriaceae bacterium UJ101]